MKTPKHLVILVHGLVGAKTDLSFMCECLRKEYDDSFLFMVPDVNQNLTHDGILNGSKRIYDFILIQTTKFNIKKISFIGHSLGGLYARGCAGMLFEKGIIPYHITPINFITFATPHLGSRYL
jgi:hypothetical protein